MPPNPLTSRPSQSWLETLADAAPAAVTAVARDAGYADPYIILLLGTDSGPHEEQFCLTTNLDRVKAHTTLAYFIFETADRLGSLDELARILEDYRRTHRRPGAAHA